MFSPFSMISEKWSVMWYEDVSLRSLFDFSVQMRKDGLDWLGTFQQSLSIHNEKDCSDPISKLTRYTVFCTSGYIFAILYFKNVLLQSYNKELPAWYHLTQSWKKSFFCSDTWQMFLVLNGMGIKDKLGPLALQPPISLISYTWFSSLSSDLLINGFSLGLREPTCNMEMRD